MHRHREKTAEERLPPSSDCANGAARCTAMGKTAEERIAPSAQYTTIGEKLPKSGLHPSSRCIIAIGKNRRRAVSYVSTGLACLPRDINASPIYRRRAVVETSSLGLHSLVAERRHSSVTRYAKRSVACRDSPRHQTLRAGGTPLPRHRRLPHHIVHHPSICASEMRSCADRASGHAFS